MEFTIKSGDIQVWLEDVGLYCPQLKSEVNRIGALYEKAVGKRGKDLLCDEHFAVIAVHRPDLVSIKSGAFVTLRCTVTWDDEDFKVESVVKTVTKKKKLVKEVCKKKKLKKVLKKKKKTLAS